LVWSALIAGGGFCLLGVNRYIGVTIVLLLVIAGVGVSRYVLFKSYMNKYIESDIRATVISTVLMINQVVRAVVYPLIGRLVEWSLSYSCIIIALIILCGLFSQVKEEHLID
jgi:hypothetical protein